MRRLRTIWLFFLTLLAMFPLMAATPSTEGTEFWVTFLENYDSYVECSLIASARENATVTIENPRTNWKASFTVKAGQVANYKLPNDQCYMRTVETVDTKGLKVTSTTPISLYASNFQGATYDATIVLPTTALGKDYIIQVFENELFPKEFAIVATQNNTYITITPHSRTTQGRVKNTPFSITLNRGQTYQVQSDDGSSDFSGTRIETNYPVAVFAGHVCINVPTGNRACDHIVEQQMPTPMWGKQFALTKTKTMNGDRVMITAQDNNTVVKMNGTRVKTLRAFESYTFRLTDNSAFVETSEPAACYSYIEGGTDNQSNGDPASVHISPVEQRIRELTFATFQTDRSRTHYINIVTTSAGAASMTLDGRNIASEFSVLQGNSAYQYAQIQISHGTHTLRTNVDGFIGHVYGLGLWESYAYTFGSATLNLNGSILVDGEPHANIIYTDERCYKATIQFAAQANIEYTSIHWDFGDGTSSTKPTVSHTYSTPGVYTITMAIANEDSKDTARTTLTLYETLHDTIHVNICEGESYSLGGRTFTKTGQYPVTLQSRAGCDSIVLLNLTVNNTLYTTAYAEFYKGSSYRWIDQWIKKAGVYTRTFTSSTGCDSIVELHLTETDPTEITYDTICWQEYYPFHGYNFQLPSIEGYQDQDFIDYTLVYTDKEKCITYRKHLSIIPQEGGQIHIINDTIQSGHSYEWFGKTYTEEGTYYNIIGGGNECKQEYTLNLTVLPYPVNVEELTLCHEDSVLWRGKTYRKAGTYNDTVWTVLGIEAVYRLVLADHRSVVELAASNVTSYDFNGTIITESGTYCDTLQNEYGCDSVVTVHVGIFEPCEIRTEVNMSLCEGESLEWNGQICSPGGDYVASLTSEGGCDSIVTLHLEQLEKKQETLSVEICEGDFYRVGETKYSDVGEYIIPLKASNGCDSTLTLQIAHKPSWADTTHVTINIGETHTWEKETYNTEGLYSKGFIANQNGCDSIVVLDLKVDKTCQATRDTTAVICFGLSQEWYGTTYDESGDYQHLLHFEDRCDTLLTLHLTVLPEAVSHENKFIYTGEQYNWNGRHYNESGTYEWHTTNNHGCDSTAWLHLTVSDKPIYDSTETVVKCSGETFIWQGEERTPSATQNTFTARLFGLDADTLIVLTVIVNPVYTSVEETQYICNGDYIDWNGIVCDEEKDYVASLHTKAGCDSIVTLHLKHYSRYADVVDPQQICEGDSYTWEGDVYTESGDYIKTLKTIHNCDSVVTLRLTVHPKCTTTDEEAMVCYGESYAWNSETYTESGIYTQHLLSTHGCDSTVTRRITVLPEAVSHENKFIYTGEQYNWNGTTYTESGNYHWKTTNGNGCDSTAWLYLTVSDKPIYDSTETTVKCSGEAFVWQGEERIPSATNNRFTARLIGEETDTVIVLTVTVNPVYPNVEETQYICAGDYIDWHGIRCEEAKDYTVHLQTKVGCDSTVTLHLHHYPTYTGISFDAEICENGSYVWEGDTYTAAGNYTKTLKTGHNCDSVVTLHLIVHPKYTTTDEEVLVCFSKSFRWNAETYSASGTYTQHLQSVHGCDSTVTRTITVLPEAVSHETKHIYTGEHYDWNGTSYTVKGDYDWHTTNGNGCDSTAWLHLDVTDKPIYDSTEFVTQCEGETYAWHGQTLTPTMTETVFTHRLIGADEDTVITLTFSLWPRYENIEEPTKYICEGESHTWEGVEYNTQGDYTRNLYTIHGCDSIVTFRLRLYQRYDNVIDNQTAYIGESYTWQGETYTEDVSVTRTLHTIHGCDSIVTLNLTFVEKPTESREEYANICAGETYSFYGESFAANTEYSVVRYGKDADTLVTLHLSVWPTYDHMEQTEWICPGQPYKWNGKEYLEEGDYTQTLSSVHECDSIVTLHLHHYTQYIQNLYDTILPGQSYDFIDHTYTQSGSYTHTLHTIHGCDSSLILNLVVNEVVMGAIQGNELCADESVVEILLTYTGTVDQVQLLFDEKAHMAGWRDTLLMMPDDRVITIPIHGRAGVYTCHISLLFHGQVATTTASTISMLYPSSVLEQAWNDVIAVLTHDYNGGYNFTSFQWYENGQIIVGETRSYLYRPLIMGGEYSALLTEQDGTQLMTCPLVVSPQSDVTLYPTIVSPLQKVNCRVSEDVDVILYDAVGNIILNTTMVRGEDYIEAPATAGIYIVNIISRVSHKSKTYKLVVR